MTSALPLHTRLRAAWLVTALVAVTASSARAQRVRVELQGEAAAVQLSGILVSLVNDHDSTVAQGLSDAQGVRLLVVSKPGTYRIVVRRIGFLPVRSDPITLTGSETAPPTVPITLPAQRVLLPTIRVTAMRKECSRNDDNALAAPTVWEQVRVALQAAEASRRDSLVRTRVTTFERQLSPGNVVTSTSSRDLGVTGTRPFSTADPSFLSQSGYIVFDSTRAATYYAPDALVLLSKEFEHDHCFGLVAGTGENAGSLGLSFRPVTDRGIADIEGTLWLNTSTLELRSLSFQYVDVQFPVDVRRIGGEIEFQRVASGAWFPSYWMLRMPRFREPPPNSYEFRPGLVLSGYTEVGATATESKQIDMRAFMAAAIPMVTPPAYASPDPAATKDTARSATVAGKPAASPASECRRPGAGIIAGIVRDESGTPIPFVNLSFEARSESPAIAGRTGCFELHAPANTPLIVLARRVGYHEHREPVQLHGDSSALLDITLLPVATALDGVTITADPNRALALTGFYDRLLDRKKGLGDGLFITPEELERRNDNRISHVLEGIPSMKVAYDPSGHGHIFGRAQVIQKPPSQWCPAALYLDGMRMSEESLDDMVQPNTLAAIEVYPRTVEAPPRYQVLNGNCGVVLFWTKR